MPSLFKAKSSGWLSRIMNIQPSASRGAIERAQSSRLESQVMVPLLVMLAPNELFCSGMAFAA